jgi:REP element-mobilizing transposase RayT
MARPPRIRGFDYLGFYRYFLTICVLDRSDVFRHARVVESTMLQFRRTATCERFEFLAYCLMPDHVHFLVAGVSESSDFRAFAKMAKQRSGSAYKKASGRHLWQEGYYDRVLRADEDLKTVARYIIENPARAGLVSSPSEYPYLGSDLWTVDEILDA